uniref:Uncharacterized protein n=1 Tax=Anopheles dirus TaxID=7168 RepID=A0A182NEA7_9DIPT
MSGPPNINNNQLPSAGGGVAGMGGGRGWLRTPPPTYFRSPSPWVPLGSAPPSQSPPVTAMRPVDTPPKSITREPSEFVYQHPSTSAYGGASYPAQSQPSMHHYSGGRPVPSTSIRATTTPTATGPSAQEYQFKRPIPSAMTPTQIVAPATTHYRPVSPVAVAPLPYPQFSSVMSPVSSVHRSMTPYSAGSSYGPIDYQNQLTQQQVRPGSTASSIYGGVVYHYGPAAGSGHSQIPVGGQSQFVIYDYGGEMGPSTAEIIAAQSQDYVDEKLAEYQATIMLLQALLHQGEDDSNGGNE